MHVAVVGLALVQLVCAYLYSDADMPGFMRDQRYFGFLIAFYTAYTAVIWVWCFWRYATLPSAFC